MRYCIRCGKQIQDTNKFCPYCGQPVKPIQDLKKRAEPTVVQEETPQKAATAHQETMPSTQPNSTAPQASTLKEIQANSFLEKWASSERINKLMKIYTTIVLVSAFILYSMVNNAEKWAENILKEDEGLETLKGIFKLLQVIPFLYYVLIIFAFVILGFAIYRFLRNFKGKVHLVYSIGLGISIIAICSFNDIMNLIQQAGGYVNQFESEGLSSLFRNDYTDTFSTVSKIAANASSYKPTAIILLIVTAALLVIAILSKMQEAGKIAVSPWIAMESDQTFTTLDVKSLQDAILSPKNKRIGIGILVLLIGIGGFTIWDKYLHRIDVDVLKNVKLEYDGISGDAEADIASNRLSYKGDDEEIKDFLNNDIHYELSKDTEVANGDTITVTALYNKDKADDLKLNLKDTKKKIKVSGLEHSFDKASDIPSEMLSRLRNDADTKIKSDYEDDDYVTYKITYINSWFVKNENSYNGDDYVACYKIDKTEKDYWDGSTTHSNYFAYSYVTGLTSAYTSDDASWYASYIDDDDVTSSNQLQGALATDFGVDESDVQSVD